MKNKLLVLIILFTMFLSLSPGCAIALNDFSLEEDSQSFNYILVDYALDYSSDLLNPDIK